MKELRSIVAGVMWIAYLVFLWLALAQIGAWIILLAFVMMIPLMLITSLLFRKNGSSPVSMSISAFNSNRAEEEQEKRKRDRIDTVLRDMSTEDLEVLKHRLADGFIDDDVLEERIIGIGDDGELITKSDQDD